MSYDFSPPKRANIKDLVREITPDFRMEDVGPLHGRILVPAEHLEAVRAAVEPHLICGAYIEYSPLETDQ
jgi:hypothetical protein